jgi:hypothetical protein
LNLPRIVSRFAYMYKPLTGVVNGVTPCLFLAIDNVLGGRVLVDVIGGAGEYAGGRPSSVSRPVEDYISLRLEDNALCCGRASIPWLAWGRRVDGRESYSGRRVW